MQPNITYLLLFLTIHVNNFPRFCWILVGLAFHITFNGNSSYKVNNIKHTVVSAGLEMKDLYRQSERESRGRWAGIINVESKNTDRTYGF